MAAYDSQIEYLESTGMQWIDLGIRPTNKTSAQMKVYNVESTGDVVFGYYNGSDYSDWRFFNAGDNMHFDCYNGRIYKYESSWMPGEWREFEIANNYVKDLETGNIVITGSTVGSFTGTRTITLNNFNNISFSKNKWAYVKVFEDGELVLDLIPVRIGQTGYMYDKVSGQLFGNSGSGQFILGDDIKPPISMPIPYQLARGNRQIMPLLPCYQFGVVSDLHVNRTDNGAPADIERMFRAFENRKVKDVFCCGDITSNHSIAHLSAFTTIKDRHPGVRFCSCNGNHDVGLTDADWQAYVGHPLRHSFAMGGDAFVFMPIALWEGSHPYSDNLSWLEDKLAEYASSRVFLFIHFPLNSNSGDFQYPGLKIGQAYGFNANSEDNAAIIQLLKNHGNAVVFSGHSHYAFQTQDGQVQGESMMFLEEEGVSYVHVPSLSLPRDRNMQYMYDGHPELQPSQGYVIDVYDKFVRVKGVEFNLTEGDGRKGNDKLDNLYVSTNIVGYLG